MKKLIISLGILGAIFATTLSGAKAIPLKSSIAEETFQTLVVMEALKKLGHDVEPIKEVAYAVGFQTLAQNSDSSDIYFFASYWQPLHDNIFDKVGGTDKMMRVGKYIENCAQGYLIDKKTAEKHNIKYINDLKDPKIAKLFDSNGNGKADLAGCNPGWGCEKVIEHQLTAYGLRDTVEHNQGEYSAIIAETISREKKGTPILYYTWTPYWVSGKMVPGVDTKWLQVTHTDHPVTKDTSLPNGANYGFNVNTVRMIANKSVAKNHPDVAKLFEVLKISVNDISRQNMLMANGENKEKDIKRHAAMWIKANQKTFDSWIAEAKKTK